MLRKSIIMLALCLLTCASCKQTSSLENVLSLEDSIALYEDEKYIDRIKKLVANGIDATDAYFSNQTPLIFASIYGYTEIVKSLIADGANVNAKDNYGYDAFIWAAVSGHTDIVKYLIGEC